MKICTKQTKCNGELKLLSEFHRDMNRPDGHKDACKECTNSYASTMKYWQKNYKEEYDVFNFNKKLYTKEKYPDVKYRSFTSFICRSWHLMISEMTKQDIDEAMTVWLGKVRRSATA